jgi:hypothetical protein
MGMVVKPASIPLSAPAGGPACLVMSAIVILSPCYFTPATWAIFARRVAVSKGFTM